MPPLPARRNGHWTDLTLVLDGALYTWIQYTLYHLPGRFHLRYVLHAYSISTYMLSSAILQYRKDASLIMVKYPKWLNCKNDEDLATCSSINRRAHILWIWLCRSLSGRAGRRQCSPVEQIVGAVIESDKSRIKHKLVKMRLDIIVRLGDTGQYC